MALVRPRWTARVARLVQARRRRWRSAAACSRSASMLDVVWASLLPVGTISALYYADRIAQLPLGVVGIAIGTALLPLLARQLRAGETRRRRWPTRTAPSSSACCSACRPPWRSGSWPSRSSACCSSAAASDPRTRCAPASALAAFAVGLPAFVLVKALTPGFFAREDTRTPLYIALAAIAANIVLNIVFLLRHDARAWSASRSPPRCRAG